MEVGGGGWEALAGEWGEVDWELEDEVDDMLGRAMLVGR